MIRVKAQARVVVLIALIPVGAGAGLWFWEFLPRLQPEIHFHAAFRLYVDDAPVDFSGVQYMHVEPCTDDSSDRKASSDEEQIEKAHLHNTIGDIVHVHRDNATWGDLFTNLNYQFNQPVVGFHDGARVENVLAEPIQPDERLLLVAGSYSDISGKSEAVPTLGRIREVERLSEDCGT